MAVTPNTILYLLKSPLELDNKNQLTFATETAQHEYFLSLPKIEVDRISYQRKDSTIRFPAHIDSLIGYNYVMYQNENYTNKWFYAYITNMRYENDGMTTITIETDCYQTWMFDIDIKKSFVVREHVNNDTVGLHTVPEGLEKGAMFRTNCTRFSFLGLENGKNYNIPTNALICIGASRQLTSNSFTPIYGTNLCGSFSGIRYFVFQADSDVNICLRALTEAGFIDDVVSVFMIPTFILGGEPTYTLVTTLSGTYRVHEVITSDISDTSRLDFDYTKPTSIDGYTPKNKKLLTGEYNYLCVTNYCGDEQNYRFEYFTDPYTNLCRFYVRGVISPSCSISLYPSFYLDNNQYNAYDNSTYSLPAPKLPICNWNSDQYTNWLASTSGNRTLNAALSVGSIIAGGALVASGAGSLVGGGLIASGLGGIANQVASRYDHSKDAIANNGSPSSNDLLFSSSICFGAYQCCIKAEYARKIDTIFDAIGYTINEMKIPNVTGRLNWNYVQTMEVAIQGTIPQEDLQTIKDMFNSGVTFWHNPSTFLDYSQNNGII